MQAEANDVNAAVEYVLSLPGSSIDARRVAVMGPSFGGVVTTLAASRSSRFAAVSVQAPGALNWERSESLRAALIQAAGKIKVPLQCVVAENDATTASAREICAAAASSGARTLLKIYPPFTGGNERPGNPPGHALFGRLGISLWDKDLLAFLSDALPR
jgi:dienelactone hydrolase